MELSSGLPAAGVDLDGLGINAQVGDAESGEVDGSQSLEGEAEGEEGDGECGAGAELRVSADHVAAGGEHGFRLAGEQVAVGMTEGLRQNYWHRPGCEPSPRMGE